LADSPIGDPIPTGEVEGSVQDWHALEISEVERLLATGRRGLSGAEAAARLSVHGPNQLEEEPPPAAVVVFFRQFRSPLIFILLAAMVVTFCSPNTSTPS
jgi:P-type Ca2+ transporter type 2C